MRKNLALGILILMGFFLVVGGVSEKYEEYKYKESLRELDRLNKLLGVSPEQLVNPASRAISEEARNLVQEEEGDYK